MFFHRCGCKSAPVNAWRARAPGGFPPAITIGQESAHLHPRTRKSLQTKGCQRACETGRGCTSVSRQNKACVWFPRQQPAPQRKHSDELPLHRRRSENTQRATPLPVCGLKATARTGHVCREEKRPHVHAHRRTRDGKEGKLDSGWVPEIIYSHISSGMTHKAEKKP